MVCRKSRVTPLKPVTVPRLELQAAVTSFKVSQWLHQELDLEDVQEFFWSDSKVALGYIGNETQRFHIFVANRVQLIQEATSAEQWGYVDSKANPPDDASRGLSPPEFLSSRWVLGHEFLWKDESQWPSNCEPKDQVFTQLSHHDPEVKKGIALATTSKGTENMLEERLLSSSPTGTGRKELSHYASCTS